MHVAVAESEPVFVTFSVTARSVGLIAMKLAAVALKLGVPAYKLTPPHTAAATITRAIVTRPQRICLRPGFGSALAAGVAGAGVPVLLCSMDPPTGRDGM